jgi:periplasmic mercuric ion binding protein
MQRLFSFLLIAGLFLTPKVSFAGGKTVTKHFTVNGVCGQCKTRIEDAAYVKGVKYADWNVKTHDLTIKYDSTKTSPEVFLKSIAKAGHDNELYKAENADYNKVANCCKYRSGIKPH